MLDGEGLHLRLVYARSHVSCAFGGAIDLRVHTALSMDMEVAFQRFGMEGIGIDELGGSPPFPALVARFLRASTSLFVLKGTGRSKVYECTAMRGGGGLSSQRGLGHSRDGEGKGGS